MGPDCGVCRAFRPVFDEIEKLIQRPNLYYYKAPVLFEDYDQVARLGLEIIPCVIIWKRYPNGRLYKVGIHVLDNGHLEFVWK